MQSSSRNHSDSSSRRGAFTLIELIIVIMVIGILMSILLPAINNVRRQARVTQVITDIKNLEKAIADFKLKYGMEPPSSFRIREVAGDWDPMNDELDRNSIAIMRKLWPSFRPTSTNLGDIDGSSNVDFTLNGAECLLFFLAGPGVINSSTGAVTANGFSTNPSNPFASGGSRVGPFLPDLDVSRLVDLDGDHAHELLDPIPNQTMPYQYLSSYNGRGYQPGGYDGNLSTTDDNEIFSMSAVYLTNDTDWGTASAVPDGTPWKPNSFQIISPGFDNEYGVGGSYSTEDGVAIKSSSGADNFREADVRQPELDNITNFSGGMLNKFNRL